MELKNEMLQGVNSVSGPDARYPAIPTKVLEYYKMYGLCEQTLKQILVNPGMGKCFGNLPAKPTIKRC